MDKLFWTITVLAAIAMVATVGWADLDPAAFTILMKYHIRLALSATLTIGGFLAVMVS